MQSSGNIFNKDRLNFSGTTVNQREKRQRFGSLCDPIKKSVFMTKNSAQFNNDLKSRFGYVRDENKQKRKGVVPRLRIQSWQLLRQQPWNETNEMPSLYLPTVHWHEWTLSHLLHELFWQESLHPWRERHQMKNLLWREIHQIVELGQNVLFHSACQCN